jgi:pimeloyl-ACP methyl ester carboxylesterase
MAKNKRMLLRKEEEPTSLVGEVFKGLGVMTLAAAAGWIAYSHLAIDHNVAMTDALPAERKEFHSPSAGRLSYYASRAASGRPLVLIHSINAAASAYEMRPVFLAYQNRRPVFALDLPGFGFSERGKRIYSPGLYSSAILDFLTSEVGEPADVVALSLGSEFVARAALVQPERFSSLTLISPSGFSYKQKRRGSQQASQSGFSNMLHPVLSMRLWGLPLYDLIATRTSIEYFLKQSFIGPVPQEMIDYDYASAHQPGAEHAPLYFISGKLFTPDIRETVYERLEVPTLVIYDRDNFTTFEMLTDTLTRNTFWQAVRLVPTLGLPQFERLDDLVMVLDKFWK